MQIEELKRKHTNLWQVRRRTWQVFTKPVSGFLEVDRMTLDTMEKTSDVERLKAIFEAFTLLLAPDSRKKKCSGRKADQPMKGETELLHEF